MPKEEKKPSVDLPDIQRNIFYQEWLGVQSITDLAVTSRNNYTTIANDQKHFWLGEGFHKAITASLSTLQDKKFKAAMAEIVSFAQEEDRGWGLGKALDPAIQRINLKRLIATLPAELQKWLAVDFIWLDYKYRKVLVRQLSIMARCAENKHLRDYLLLGGVKYAFSYSHFFGVSKVSPKTERKEFLKEFFQNFSDGSIENQQQEFVWIYEARHKMQKINQQLVNYKADIERWDLEAQSKAIALQFFSSPFFKAQLFYASDTKDDFGLDVFLSTLKNDLQRELSARQIAALKVGINVEQLQQLENILSQLLRGCSTLMQNDGSPQPLSSTWSGDLVDYTSDVGSADDLKYELFYDVIKQKLGYLLFYASYHLHSRHIAFDSQEEVADVELLIKLGAEFNLELKLPVPRYPNFTQHPLVSLADRGGYKGYKRIDFHIGLIDLLLTRGALVNVYDYSKNTPLALACAVKSMDARVIKMLLNAGANPNLQNTRGRSSLHYFAGYLPSHLERRALTTEQGLLDMHDENEGLALLLNAGADINCKDDLGKKAYDELSRCNDSVAVWNAGLQAHKKLKEAEGQAQTQISTQKSTNITPK